MTDSSPRRTDTLVDRGTATVVLAPGRVGIAPDALDEPQAPCDGKLGLDPFSKHLTAKSHRPVYQMHRYFARRPHNLFAELVSHYTREGDLVIDPFMGGGVTLVEATERGRRAIGFDTSPLSAFVTRTELLELDLDAYSAAVASVLGTAREELRSLYHTECRTCSATANAHWFEHSLVARCVQCNHRFPTSEATKSAMSTWTCPECESPVKAIATADSAVQLVTVAVDCSQCGFYAVKPSAADAQRQAELDATRQSIIDGHLDVIPCAAIPDNNMQRESALHKKGFKRFEQLFTSRQLHALVALRQAIDLEPEALKPHLMLAFSSTLRYASRMVTRNPGWRGNRPLEWVGTGFWIPATFLDANLELEFARRAKAVIKGKRDFPGSPPSSVSDVASPGAVARGSAWAVEVRSSTTMPLEDQSVDAIITDPPYGAYVHYADLSNFWNVWLPQSVVDAGGLLVDDREEAVVARKQFPGSKSVLDYTTLLSRIFAECYRVLRAGRPMVLTFNNREPRAWSALLVAVLQAGFSLPPGGVHFQPGVKNYRHTAKTRRTGSVYGDFVFTFVRSAAPSTPATRQIENPLTAGAVEARIERLLADGSQTTTDFLASFYESIIPDLASYIGERVKTPLAAAEYLEQVSEIDILNSERGDKLRARFAGFSTTSDSRVQ